MTKHHAVALLVLFSPHLDALEVDKEICMDAVADLGFTKDSYEFKDGWLTDKHVFGGEVECYEKDGSLFVSAGREVLVEDGFFGQDALEARDLVLSTQAENVSELRASRDAVISQAKDDYDAATAVLDEDTQQQLQVIRDEGVPDSISVALESARMKREAEEDAAAFRKTEREAERGAEAAARKAAKAAEELEEKEKGFHCLSGWSGTHRDVTRMIESMLNDPSSFEHDETRVAPVVDGRHQFVMRYRAKNGLGGVVIGTAKGSYGHEDCSDVEITQAQ